MRRLMVAVVAVVLSAAGSLSEQNLAGTWQATIQASGRQFRAVIRISLADSGGLSATLDRPDEDGQPFGASTVSLQGSNVRIAIPALGDTFEGRLSADGNTMTGTWQGVVSQQVSFTRATPTTAWALPEPPPAPKVMPAKADPSFDVAVIKPSSPDAPVRRLNIDQSGRVELNNFRLDDLVCFAYRLHPQQLRGIPDALGSQRFDIEAKPDTPGQPSDAQVRSMLGKLLAERFMIAAHSEMKELTVYAIEVTKTGPKLTKSQSNAALPNLNMRGAGRAVIQNATIGDFAGYLQAVVLDRPVVDQSTLQGRFDFTLNWTPDETQFSSVRRSNVPASDPNAETFPDLFTAMQQQLGLKLESVKARVDVLVIDHIQKPSDN